MNKHRQKWVLGNFCDYWVLGEYSVSTQTILAFRMVPFRSVYHRFWPWRTVSERMWSFDNSNASKRYHTDVEYSWSSQTVAYARIRCHTVRNGAIRSIYGTIRKASIVWVLTEYSHRVLNNHKNFLVLIFVYALVYGTHTAAYGTLTHTAL